MNVRLLRHGFILALVALALGLAPGQAQTLAEVEDAIRWAAAEQGANASQLLRVANCESRTSRRRLDPFAVGAAGEQGLFQLHPRGLRVLFFDRGFDDVWDVAQQASFAAWAFTHGLAHHWACR